MLPGVSRRLLVIVSVIGRWYGRHMLRNDDELDRYLGLVAAGWALVFTVPPGALPIACLLLERRRGHAVAMLVVAVLEVVLAAVLLAHHG